MSISPIVTIKNQTLKKISDENNFNQSVCTFSASDNVAKWEARAVLGNKQPSRGEGTLVESGGFLQKGNEAKVIIDFPELKNGDGLYTISIYAQDVFGNWSDGTFTTVHVGIKYNHSFKFNTGFKYN